MSTPPAPATPDVSSAEPPAERRSNRRLRAREGASFPRERARHAVAQGMKAAGLTAAGLAAGAVLESHTKLSRKLPNRRRPKRARAIRDAITKRLP